MKTNLLLVFTAILLSGVLNDLKAQKDSTQLVSTWRTYNYGFSNDSSIQMYTNNNYSYNYDVDWNNDGVFDSLGVTGNITHQYNDTGTYTIRIRGVFPSINFGGFNVQDREKLISFDQWGTTVWLDLYKAFQNCKYMVYNATDVPILDSITSTSDMFNRAFKFNGNIDNWDVSNVLNMQGMFYDCFVFNQPLNSWDVSSVVLFTNFLNGAFNFNQPLNNWDVSSAITMRAMFAFSSFNNPINSWDVSSVVDMSDMFNNCNKFNQPLNNWDVSSVTSMSYMFCCTDSLNQPLNNWDVSSVKDMSAMFSITKSFNQPLNNWVVDSVENMRFMFNDAIAFNQPINNWNVSKVKNMWQMLRRTFAFDQNLANWDIDSVTNMNEILDYSNMSTSNYDSLLISWQVKSHPLNINFGAQGLNYCNGDSARTGLIANGWTFNGDNLNCISVGIEDEINAKSIVANSEIDLFEVYPNPSNGVLTIKFNEENKLGVAQLYTCSGQLVKELYLNQTENILSLEDLTKGMYFIKINGQTKMVIIH